MNEQQFSFNFYLFFASFSCSMFFVISFLLFQKVIVRESESMRAAKKGLRPSGWVHEVPRNCPFGVRATTKN